ncbi:MAG: hypothetical protein K2N79_00785 [Muribaculaceae bacterium]|nr:hypothetical protein [Muribaculaceae bacterium]
MKRILINLFIILIAFVANAQNDVTQFLGIPVDGTKYEMTQKLKAKGFKPTTHDPNVLEGEFNGVPVYLHIATNGNKVWRIMLCDKNNVNERSIQIRFNNLCQQFDNNPKYTTPYQNTLIPDDENIKYEMLVHNKRYQAAFVQKPLDYMEKLEAYLLTKYTPEQIGNPTKEIHEDLCNMAVEFMQKYCLNKSVWFMISEYFGEYGITMFYDNENNKANGEDL